MSILKSCITLLLLLLGLSVLFLYDTYALEKGDLVIDRIHGSFPGYDAGYREKVDPFYIQNIAQSQGFGTVAISQGNTIIASDLANASVFVMFAPRAPYYTDQEIQLVLDFVEKGGGLYVVPYFDYYDGDVWVEEYPDPYYNLLYQTFGFKISGEIGGLHYTPIRNVTSSHAILDGIGMIDVFRYGVCNLSSQTLPSNPLFTAEDRPLFLVANYGLGRIFVDLTNCGIGYLKSYDNQLLVRNALLWVSENSPNIPEFPSLVLPSLAAALLLTAVLYKKRGISKECEHST